MKVRNILRRASVAASAIPFALVSVLSQPARAEMYRSVSAGQEDWVRVTFDEGRHAIIANSPGSLGDVDITLYNSSKEYLMHANRFGTDRLDFTVSQGGTFYVKYRMATCANPFGPCNVSLDFF
ncbi:hypothetical protein ACSYAD_29240 [Acaryochloris marina NIES-2412]|uniref:hypothetical protein n=1 Tax=Acaryochloris marina TaxID=155978 RepID=UPI004059A81C